MVTESKTTHQGLFSRRTGTEVPRVTTVFLNVGDLAFGPAGTWLRTLLGSCVAVTLWHPARRLGGMCHILVPERPGHADGPDGPGAPDGRYAPDALALLVSRAQQAGGRPQEYVAKVFGGARQLPGELDSGVPERNVRAAEELLAGHGVPVVARDVGGQGPRLVAFDVATGDVWVRHRSLIRRGSAA